MPPHRSIALLGGLYSNYLALEAALRDARVRDVDALYCLGDLGAFGPHPDRVYPLLKEAGVRTLAGNYDDSLARNLADCQCGYTDPRDNHFAKLSYDYTFSNTSGQNKRHLATLPRSMRLELAGQRILLCHGSPRRQNEFLWESTSPDHFLEKLCDDFETDVIAVTHSGIKWQRALPSGRLIVNVGVLGRPENDGTPRVWYTILSAKHELSEGDELSESHETSDSHVSPPRAMKAGDAIDIQFVPIDYDHSRLAREMRDESLPKEFIETVTTGWWTTCLEILPAKERLRGKF